MNTELFHDAMGMIDDDLIESVGTLREGGRHRGHLMRWASLAACLCITAGIVWIWSGAELQNENSSDGFDEITNSGGVPEGITQTEGELGGVMIPKMTINLDVSKKMMTDMRGFFIYNGRSYVEYEYFDEDVSFVGEHLARVDGGIDEWSTSEDYIELSGSVSGELYTVTGYDPSFMLCMKLDNGVIATYINDNDITLRKGAELFEDRLQLSDGFTVVEFQTHEDWYYSRGNSKAWEEPDRAVPEAAVDGAESENSAAGILDLFLKALSQGDFVYTEAIPLDEDEASLYDRELYHLFFRMENGMTTHLRLYDGGYVRLDGLIPVCVQMDEGIFNQLITTLGES